MKVWSLFRLGHPPLLIPWKEIGKPRVKRLLWYETVSFTVGDPEIARIAVSKKLFDRFPVARELRP